MNPRKDTNQNFSGSQINLLLSCFVGSQAENQACELSFSEGHVIGKSSAPS